ncbi:MAG: hypothetical protein AB9921_00040 [Erysipelotrichaceae bacterium]
MKWDVFDDFGEKIGEIVESTSDNGDIGFVFKLIIWILIFAVIAIAVLIWPLIIYTYFIESSFNFDILFLWFMSFIVISTLNWIVVRKITKIKTENKMIFVYILNVLIGFLLGLLMPKSAIDTTFTNFFMSFELSFGSSLIGLLVSNLILKIVKSFS